MNARQVLEALHLRWPDDQYLKLEEVGEDASRQGRRIDLLVLSTWRSRGFQRDAVEIKVSMNDLRGEIKKPEKADFWWRHTHRFWIAVPSDLAKDAKKEIPPNWGLLACTDKGTRAVVKPEPNRNPEPFTWEMQIGMMRVAADAGAAIRSRSYSEGWEAGRKACEQRIGGKLRTPEDDLKISEYERLKQRVAEFEQETGIEIASRDVWGDLSGKEVGRVVKTLRTWRANPILWKGRLTNLSRALMAEASEIDKLLRVSEEVLRPEGEGEAA